MSARRTQTAPKRSAGRPAVYGARMASRSLALPASTWRALDDEAHEARISTAELIRRRLGVAPSGRGKGG